MNSTQPIPPNRIAEDFLDLSGGNEEKSREAFGRLFEMVRGPLLRYLAARGLSQVEAEDAVQSTALRLWKSRASFEVRGLAAWWRYVQKVGESCTIDAFRKSDNGVSDLLSDAEEIPDVDLPYLEVLLFAAADRERLYEAADALWLGPPPQPGRSGQNALVALQLLWIDGLDHKEVRNILRTLGEEPRELDSWLRDPSILVRFAYTQLYWDNRKLICYVLRPDRPLALFELETLHRNLMAGESAMVLELWGRKEALVLILRILNGLLSQQVLRFSQCTMDAAELDLVFDRATHVYPFAGIARRLSEGLDAWGVRGSVEVAGLWRRLVFQYYVKDELPQKQILERVSPAASVLQAKITEGMLNGWISMNRLLSQLAAFLHGDDLCA